MNDLINAIEGAAGWVLLLTASYMVVLVGIRLAQTAVLYMLGALIRAGVID